MARANFFLTMRKTNRHPYLAAAIHYKSPQLKPGEIVVSLDIDVPESLFRKPSLTAKITIPEAQHPPVITASVKADVAQALSDRLGLEVSIVEEKDP